MKFLSEWALRSAQNFVGAVVFVVIIWVLAFLLKSLFILLGSPLAVVFIALLVGAVISGLIHTFIDGP